MSGHAPPDALSITALAKRIGVSKQAVHRRISALVAAGQIQTFDGPNRSVLVSASAYDFAVAKNGDPAREATVASSAALSRTAPEQAADDGVEASPGYRDAKARDAYYAAELKRLTFEREKRQVYPVTEVNAALLRIAERVRECARGFVSKADAGAEAYEAGMPSFRRFLSNLGDDFCRSLAADWRILADSAETSAEMPHPEQQPDDDQ